MQLSILLPKALGLVVLEISRCHICHLRFVSLDGGVDDIGDGGDVSTGFLSAADFEVSFPCIRVGCLLLWLRCWR